MMVMIKNPRQGHPWPARVHAASVSAGKQDIFSPGL